MLDHSMLVLKLTLSKTTVKSSVVARHVIERATKAVEAHASVTTRLEKVVEGILAHASTPQV
jgi:hypothetical protein